METQFQQSMTEVTNKEPVIGCVLTDQTGLCLGVKGEASSDSSGVIAALNNLAKKLEPNSSSPIISLQSGNRQCLIQQQGAVIGAIFKNGSS